MRVAVVDVGRMRVLVLDACVPVTVRVLGSVGGNGSPRTLPANQLEVAVLDRTRPSRKFKRITGAALSPLLPADTTGRPAEPAPADTPRHDADDAPDSPGTADGS